LPSKTTRHTPLVSGNMLDKDAILFSAYYAYTSGKVIFDNNWSRRVAQSYFFRKVPKHLGRYILAVGLEQVIAHIQNIMKYKLQDRHYEWLKATSGGDMSEDFMDYLRHFNPDFNIWAVPEGTPMFPNEPIITIEGRYIDIQIIEDALLTIMNHQSLVATKASRMRYACGNRTLADFGARRAHGMGAGLIGARAGYIGGTDGTSLVLAGFKFGIPYIGTMPHAFIQQNQSLQRYDQTEAEAFAQYAKAFPDNAILLPDTYSTINGVINAINIGRELRKTGHELKGIRLDSGNLTRLSIIARKMLDSAGMSNAKIFASDNIDEYKMKEMLTNRQTSTGWHEGARIDGFGVGTRLQTGANVNGKEGGTSALGGILKIVEVEGKPSMKFTDNPEKCTIPSRQQVWRKFNEYGKFTGDYISTFDEVPNTKHIKSLLVPIMKKGDIVYTFPHIESIKSYVKVELDNLPSTFRNIGYANPYPVKLTPKLTALRDNLMAKYDQEFPKTESPYKPNNIGIGNIGILGDEIWS